MSKVLVFNGINGATGDYGLSPMTSEKLADHILGNTAPEPDVRQELVLRRDSAAKIAAIVRLLAGSNAEEVERNADWFDNWLDRLAATLAKELLKDVYAEGDRLEALKDRLRWHTIDKIVDIVEFLAQGKEKELAELLLLDQDQADDDRGTLNVKLRQDIGERLDDVQRELLASG